MGKRVNLSKIEKPVKDDNNSDGTVTLTGEELRIFLNVLHKNRRQSHGTRDFES